MIHYLLWNVLKNYLFLIELRWLDKKNNISWITWHWRWSPVVINSKFLLILQINLLHYYIAIYKEFITFCLINNNPRSICLFIKNNKNNLSTQWLCINNIFGIISWLINCMWSIFILFFIFSNESILLGLVRLVIFFILTIWLFDYMIYCEVKLVVVLRRLWFELHCGSFWLDF